MRALVIDDSRAIRSVLTKMLKELGFEVFEAGQGLDGLDQLRKVGKIDLALVDWNMPEMNGYQFVCAVRSDPAYNNLRLMMVTTESELSQMVSVLNAGADEYVMKPFTREIIFEKLCLLNLSDSGKNPTN
ncbi:MAG TPA: response regulator [Acidobacteriota bacterium]|nr:response regulator [Acidobacteriota bacterium]HNB72764.1 response regulator [Acidobacteriota bacterium]HND20594.1 response regulator [Acidobacteriota bacterium]HNG94650.1 response regulator [Acidobacteriota bacterium]HNJ43108.1 response regulator [Acidobacteriota bacterium]